MCLNNGDGLRLTRYTVLKKELYLLTFQKKDWVLLNLPMMAPGPEVSWTEPVGKGGRQH